MKWGPAFRPFIFVLLIFALPSFAAAQVVINEVMYNPQGTDTGREWVELYNEGQSDVTMVGGSGKGSWRINDGSNHTLTDPASGTGRGSLTIPAGGYLMIASDPNDFISGEYAGGIYSVVKSSISLNNNGATVTLLDGTGATVDSVSYLPSQGANDDSSSLQKQSDGSWIAALPTPGAVNSSIVYVAPQTVSPATTSQTNTSSDQSDASSTDSSLSQAAEVESSYVAPPAPNLYADAGDDRTVIVGADVEFDASAYDKTQTLLDPSTVRFMWNFGDGATAEGSSVLHHFSYPGRYAVILEIADSKDSAPAQLTVTAQPAALSFSLLQNGGVEIQNLAGHDLDLSDWIIRENSGAFAYQFILPSDSKILSGSSMNIPAETLQFHASSSTMLEYPNGVLALAMGESSAATTAPPAVPTQNTAPITAAVTQKPVATAMPEPSQSPPDAETGSDDSAQPDPAGIDATGAGTGTVDFAAPSTSTILQTASAASSPFSKYLWWIGVGALALAAALAAIAASHFKKGEWDIIEDGPE